MTPKTKTNKPGKPRLNYFGFLVLWFGGYLLAWLAFLGAAHFWIEDSLPASLLNNSWFMGLVFGLSLGIPISSIQKLALYLRLGRPFRGWLRANILGWILGVLTMIAAAKMGFLGFGIFYIPIFSAVHPLLFIPILVQAWIFKKYFQNIWPWLLGTSVAGLTFAGIFLQYRPAHLLTLLTFGGFGAITALGLLWLFDVEIKGTKLKINQDNAIIGRLEDKAQDEMEQIIETDLGSHINA